MIQPMNISLRRSIAMNHNEIKTRAHKELEDDTVAHRLIYVPLCMTEVVWDMVDTVLDLCAIRRISEVKKASRTLKQMRKDSDYHFRRLGINDEMLEPIRRWRDMFLDSTDGSNELYAKIKREFAGIYTDMQDDELQFITTAKLAHVYSLALVEYTSSTERDFARRVGLPNYGSTLPKPVRDIPMMLDAITCHRPISESFIKSLKNEICDLMDEIAESPLEPMERYAHRHRCIAYICNNGCRAMARHGEFGCFPTCDCRRLRRYDKKQHDNGRTDRLRNGESQVVETIS